MTAVEHREVCSHDAECQQAAVIYYKECTWSHGRPVIKKWSLCEHHAQPALAKAAKNPLRHLVVRVDQQEFPF